MNRISTYAYRYQNSEDHYWGGSGCNSEGRFYIIFSDLIASTIDIT